MSSDTPSFALPPELAREVEAARGAAADRAAAARALSLLDFTSLNDDDDDGRIEAFCRRALTPTGKVAAVCVYPAFVRTARRVLAGTGVRVASVANFPSGGADAAAAADETRTAIEKGAEEVDIVFPYKAHFAGERAMAAAVVRACRKACGDEIPLKVILETSQIADAATLAEISRIAIDEGADFLKTSTGKLGAGATLEGIAVMLDAIRSSGRRVGIKPSGGIRTTAQAAGFLALGSAMMDPDYLAPGTFRIGASSIMGDLLKTLGVTSDAPSAPPPGSY